MSRDIRLASLILLMILLTSCSQGRPPASTQQPGVTGAPETPIAGMAPTSDKFPTMEVHADVPPTVPAAARPTATGRPPAQAQAPTEPIPGMELESFMEKRYLLAIEAGAYWFRRNAILWSDVERTEGKLNWSVVLNLEKELAFASAQGVQMMVIVRGAPAWAQKLPGVICGPILPEKLPAFANFMFEVVKRYSAPPYNVRYWELGNEPDIDPNLTAKDSPFGCWGDANDPYYGGGQYAEMLKVVYPKIKEADPEAQVLVGGLLLDCDPINPPEGKNCTPSRYLEGILKNGGGDYFDGVSFHAYDYYVAPHFYGNGNWNSGMDTYGPVLVPKARYLRSVLNANGYPGKFLINTESGLVCGRDGSEAICQTEEFNQTKASYVAQANVSALAEGLRGNLWYSLTGWRGTALIDRSSKPYPAYEAFKFSANQISKARYVREITDFPGVRGYELERNGVRIWFLTSADGQDHTITLPNQPAAIQDMLGESLPPSTEVTITNAPVYIELKP